MDAELGRPHAVTTKEAKAYATSNAKKSLLMISTSLLSLNTRDERVAKVQELLKNAHPEAQNFIAITTRREKEHADFMNNVLLKIDELDMTVRHPHDCSKDKLFLFVVPCYYDGGLQEPEMKELMQSELKRHHIHEPHHPEYEKYNNIECSRLDILEMAIDRLSRNAQFGDGIIRLDGMKKFLPTFTLGDVEAKQDWYWDCVLKYKDFVQSEFYSMFPESKEWGEQQLQETMPNMENSKPKHYISHFSSSYNYINYITNWFHKLKNNTLGFKDS